MNKYQIYRRHVDEGINYMHEFIKKFGERPIKPDLCNGKAYSIQRLGDLGEQYIMCLLKQINITKLPETDEPSPDFEITINEKKFKIEVKTISNLYKNLLEILSEIAEEEKNNKIISDKVKNIFENYDFDINPFEVHREDEIELKEVLKKKFENFSIHEYLFLKDILESKNFRCYLTSSMSN